MENVSDAMPAMPTMRRKPLNVSGETLVRTRYLENTDKFPLVIEPAFDGIDVLNWLRGATEYVSQQLDPPLLQ